MKLCPKCGRFGVELNWYGWWECLWYGCGYKEKEYVKPYRKQKFKKFAESITLKQKGGA